MAGNALGLILAPTGSILQFADGIQSIPQIAGSPELFEKQFYSGILIGNTGSLTIPRGATIDVLAGGTLSNSGIQKNIYTLINTATIQTSSLTNTEQFMVTGSYIRVYNTHDHKLIVGSALSDYVIRYHKRDNNSNMIMVSGSSTGASTWINGQRVISSSDAYAAIELIGTNTGWRIVSMYGTWA